MSGSRWRVLTKSGPLEKEMANQFSILAVRTPWAVWKGKRYDTERRTPQVSRYPHATEEGWRHSSRKNKEGESKGKQHPAVDVTSEGSEVWRCKEQYCIGTLNVGSMSQGKWDAVKQEMARVNIYILGISELKWTRTGKFNSDDHYLYYCGQESLRRKWFISLTVNKSIQNAVLRLNL